MYGVALVRNLMDDDMKDICKAAGGTMKGIRNAAADPENKGFKEACMRSVLPVSSATPTVCLSLSLNALQHSDACFYQQVRELLATRYRQFYSSSLRW